MWQHQKSISLMLTIVDRQLYPALRMNMQMINYLGCVGDIAEQISLKYMKLRDLFIDSVVLLVNEYVNTALTYSLTTTTYPCRSTTSHNLFTDSFSPLAIMNHCHYQWHRFSRKWHYVDPDPPGSVYLIMTPPLPPQ